jgi:hypothetical protein
METPARAGVSFRQKFFCRWKYFAPSELLSNAELPQRVSVE